MSIFTYEWRFGVGTVWPLIDPGPCPVDDTPHTCCTSADYQPKLIVPQLPARDALVAGDTPPPPPSTQSVVVAPKPPIRARRTK